MQGFAPLFRMLAERIEALLADEPVSIEVERGYDADAIRNELANAGAEAASPAKSNRWPPTPHDREKHRWRNLIERLFNEFKNWRRVVTRDDETAESYLGFVTLASVKLRPHFPRCLDHCAIQRMVATGPERDR